MKIAQSTGEKFFAPISHSPIPNLHFSLLISLESSRRSSQKKDSISEKKFRKRFHADLRR